jgi:uncharacterized protein
MKIQIVHASPTKQRIDTIDMPDGSTVGDALAKAQSTELFPAERYGCVGVARFGKPAAEQDILADGDRIELLRPLVADPKESRRRRADVQARRKRSK